MQYGAFEDQDHVVLILEYASRVCPPLLPHHMSLRATLHPAGVAVGAFGGVRVPCPSTQLHPSQACGGPVVTCPFCG